MSIFGVVSALERHAIVNLGHTWVGEVCGAISYLYLDSEGNCEGYRPIDIPVSDFAALCDAWKNGEHRSKPNIPEIFVLEGDCLYDFSQIPSMDCPVCLGKVSFKTAIRSGRFAYCHLCNSRLFKAPRMDGTRDKIETYNARPKQAIVVKKEKEPTPDQMTVEELVAKGMLKPRISNRRILVA